MLLIYFVSMIKMMGQVKCRSGPCSTFWKKGRRESSFVVVFGILGMIHQRDNTHWLLTGTIKWEGDWVREGGGGKALKLSASLRWMSSSTTAYSWRYFLQLWSYKLLTKQDVAVHWPQMAAAILWKFAMFQMFYFFRHA